MLKEFFIAIGSLMKYLFHFVVRTFYWVPGVPALYAATKDNIKSAMGEFLSSFVFSLLPLLAIYGIEVLRSKPTNFSPLAIFQYLEAGQIFFYVGPIIGGVFYLVLTDLRKNSENTKKTDVPERIWFLVYLILCPIASVIILVLYHTEILNNSEMVIYLSLFIYAISLYFNFINTLYGHISINYNNRTGIDQKNIVRGLDGFTGEH